MEYLYLAFVSTVMYERITNPVTDGQPHHILGSSFLVSIDDWIPIYTSQRSY